MCGFLSYLFVVSLNDGNIFDIIFSDEFIMDIIGALECEFFNIVLKSQSSCSTCLLMLRCVDDSIEQIGSLLIQGIDCLLLYQMIQTWPLARTTGRTLQSKLLSKR